MNAEQGTILVVEDDRAARELLVMALEGHGFQVRSVGSVAEAMDILDSASIQVLLLDLQLGHESGLAIVEQLRRRPRECSIPVLLLTGLSDRQSVLAAARLGVNDYFRKQELSRRVLLSRLQHLLEEREVAPVDDANTYERPGLQPLDRGADPIARECAQASEMPAADHHAEESVAIRTCVVDRLNQFAVMRALSPTVTQLLQMTESANCSIEEIAQVVQKDPAISLKVLKIANSVIYNRGNAVDTVQKAISRIGLKQIRQTVLNIGVIDSFQGQRAGAHFDPRLFWEHSIATGLTAAMLTRARQGKDSAVDAAFTAGLLHDVGRLILVDHFGDTYEKVLADAWQNRLPLEIVESREFSCHHAQLMERFLKVWGFPEHLVAPIAMHHMSMTDIRMHAPTNVFEVGTLALANRLVHAMLLGCSGNDGQYSTIEFAEALGYTATDIASVETQVPKEADTMRSVLFQSPASTSWPNKTNMVRSCLAREIRPLFVSDTSSLDSFQILMRQLSSARESRRPNLAVMHLANPQRQSALTKKLRETELASSTALLPLIIITENQHEDIDDQLVNRRKYQMLSSPFALSALLDAVNELLVFGES